MSDPPPTPPPSTEDERGAARCAAFETEDGVVVYDTEETRAWLQSDVAVDLDAMS